MPDHSVALSPAGFGKIFLHCFKYPSRAVTGFVIGKTVDEVLYVDDVLPMFHTYTQLVPVVEVGLEHAREWAKAKGMEVIGFYSAPASNVDRSAPSKFTESVMKLITSTYTGRSLVIQVLNQNIKLGFTEIPYKFYSGDDLKNGRTAESGICKIQYHSGGALYNIGDAQAPFERVREAVKDGMARELVDFESHLEDLTCDWTAETLAKYLTQNVAPLE
eukprot:TRINITY_DN15698_c0_g1_i1.p1 TRINITY_DN15698_c0_g1~~TRINITY_DN15698_c0_g1_i1.p1  ORF type:complete len:218 (+),score=34.58 TRINITY_DN15698_c0_g1_i1:47-700(+)